MLKHHHFVSMPGDNFIVVVVNRNCFLRQSYFIIYILFYYISYFIIHLILLYILFHYISHLIIYLILLYILS